MNERFSRHYYYAVVIGIAIFFSSAVLYLLAAMLFYDSVLQIKWGEVFNGLLFAASFTIIYALLIAVRLLRCGYSIEKESVKTAGFFKTGAYPTADVIRITKSSNLFMRLLKCVKIKLLFSDKKGSTLRLFVSGTDGEKIIDRIKADSGFFEEKERRYDIAASEFIKADFLYFGWILAAVLTVILLTGPLFFGILDSYSVDIKLDFLSGKSYILKSFILTLSGAAAGFTGVSLLCGLKILCDFLLKSGYSVTFYGRYIEIGQGLFIKQNIFIKSGDIIKGAYKSNYALSIFNREALDIVLDDESGNSCAFRISGTYIKADKLEKLAHENLPVLVKPDSAGYTKREAVLPASLYLSVVGILLIIGIAMLHWTAVFLSLLVIPFILKGITGRAFGLNENALSVTKGFFNINTHIIPLKKVRFYKSSSIIRGYGSWRLYLKGNCSVFYMPYLPAYFLERVFFSIIN